MTLTETVGNCVDKVKDFLVDDFKNKTTNIDIEKMKKISGDFENLYPIEGLNKVF